MYIYTYICMYIWIYGTLFKAWVIATALLVEEEVSVCYGVSRVYCFSRNKTFGLKCFPEFID